MFLDVIDRLADGLDLLGLFVGDRELELILELHDQLHGIEAVGVEVVDEVRFAGDLALIDAHLLADDLDDFAFDVFHRCFREVGESASTRSGGGLGLSGCDYSRGLWVCKDAPYPANQPSSSRPIRAVNSACLASLTPLALSLTWPFRRPRR